MTSITTDSRVAGRKVWVQTERDDPISLICEPDTKNIDDLKRMVFGDNRGKYKAFHRGQYIRPDDPIPADVSGREPIQFKLIEVRRSTQSSSGDDIPRRIVPLETNDASGTQTLLDNLQLAAKCNQCMNNLRSHYDANIINNVNSSRDCLISTTTNSSDSWTLNGLLCRTANILWRRMTNGHSASYKSKSD